MARRVAREDDGLPLLSFPEEFRALEGGPLNLRDARFDLRPAPLSKVLVIASMPRSGSTLVSEDLRVSGQAGVPTEYLAQAMTFLASETEPFASPTRLVLPKARASWRAVDWASKRLHRDGSPPFSQFSSRSIESYLKRVAALRTTPNGVFSIKMQGSQMPAYVGERRGISFESLGAPVLWLHLSRRDTLGQAISWTRAYQTEQWFHSSGERRAVSYDEQTITQCLERIRRGEAWWEEYFARRGITPLAMDYEDYAEDRRAGVRRILEHFDLGYDDFELSAMRKQADEVSAEWRERFLASSSQQP